MGVSLNPIRILKHNADEERAETARLSSFVGAMAIGDLVKSTLGPKGMDTDKIKVFGSRVKVDNVSQIAELELAEKEKMKDKVEMICGHDMNVFINRQLIYNYPEQLFADKGIMAIEHADFDGIERLALVTG